MRILGIDPGYAILGYGVVEKENGKLRALDYGVIETFKDMPFPERNTTTAIAVGAGRGVSILAAQQTDLPIYEYTPMQIKLAVTGDGHADKHAVQQMVRMLLGLKEVPKPDDAADALAAALCHSTTITAAKDEYRIR